MPPRHPTGQEAKCRLQQSCAAAIIQVIEASAKSGFKCFLHTDSGRSEQWRLFPVLARMEFDTKERTKFFGLARERACGCGSGPHKGRSLFRECTPHSRRKSQTADSLLRHGLKREVPSLKKCNFCILRWPTRTFHGLFAYDVLHCMYINSIRYLQEALLELLTPTQQKILDKRVRNCYLVKNPVDGTTASKVTSLTGIGYLSGEQRVRHLFLWSHAVGSKAEIFPEALREIVLSSISSMQIMCFAVRGNRAFTRREHRHVSTCAHPHTYTLLTHDTHQRHTSTTHPHDMHPRHTSTTCIHDILPRHTSTTYMSLRYIFSYHGRRFFRGVSRLMSWTRQKKIESALSYNDDKPPDKRRRVPYVQKVDVDSCESSDTVESSGEEFPVDMEHGNKIVPHFIVHMPEQVVMGGTHQFHNTVSQEASHKVNVKHAGLRSRIYSDVNVSARNLLQFSMNAAWFEEIFRLALDGVGPTQKPNCQPDFLQSISVSTLINDNTDALRTLCRKMSRLSHLGVRWRRHTESIWDMVLSEQIPVSVRELVSLLAAYVGYSVGEQYTQKLVQCSWGFGLRLKTRTHNGVTRSYYAGDWLETNIADFRNGVTTSRLLRVVCAVSLRNFRDVTGMTLPNEVYQTDANKNKDEAHFLLVRYAHAHPLSRGRRGPNHRPLCPGLQDTHCLWEWYKRAEKFRRGCFQGQHWIRNKSFFGDTHEAQEIRKERESHAWYDLVQTSNISSYANVMPDPDRENTFLQSVLWF